MRVVVRIVLGIMVCVALSPPALAEPLRLRYANSPPASTFPCIQMERWADEVERRTKGAVEIETYPGATLAGAGDMQQAVAAGKADIGCISLPFAQQKTPVCTLFEEPLGFTSATVACATFWDMFQRYAPPQFKSVKVLTVFTSGPSCLMSKVPVRGLGDFEGLEVRAIGNGLDIIRRLGGVPVSLPMSMTGDALHKGTVKGVLSSLDVLMDMNFAEYCRYQVALNLHVYPFVVVINRAVWEGLPKAVQQVMEDLSREHAVWTGQYVDAHTRKAVSWAVKRHNVQFLLWPEADLRDTRVNLDVGVTRWMSRARDAGYPASQMVRDVVRFKAQNRKRYGAYIPSFP